jgi:hypothetical protein
MECAICSDVAVGFCGHCHVALCRQHLADSWRQGAGGMRWSCEHGRKAASMSRTRAEREIRSTLRSVAKALSSAWPAAE